MQPGEILEVGRNCHGATQVTREGSAENGAHSDAVLRLADLTRLATSRRTSQGVSSHSIGCEVGVADCSCSQLACVAPQV
jgi:hypothetical protein